MIVAVGSTNPTKVNPVKEIFSHHFGSVDVIGVAVSSSVSDQPMSDEEMFKGALNRAKSAIAATPNAEYGVGIEGGLDHRSYGWFESSTIVIVDRNGNIGTGATGGIIMPDRVIELIQKEDKNLEQAVDQLFGTHEIGEGIGMFGLFTKEVVTRSEAVKQGIAFALSRFLHPDLYK